MLKVPRYGCENEDRWGVLENNLRKEGLVLQALQSRRLPRLLHMHPEGRWLLREFFEGENLRVLGKRASCPAVRLMWTVDLLDLARECFALFHNHPARSYVIRDFKPRNCIVDVRDNTLRLVDCGGVRPEDDMVRQCPSRERAGTGKWLCWPPEQMLEMRGLCDRRVDYFALGVSSFHALLSRYPYSNKETSPREMLCTYCREYPYCAVQLRTILDEAGLAEKWTAFLVSCIHPLTGERPNALPTEPIPVLGPPRSVAGDFVATSQEDAETRFCSGELSAFRNVVCLRRQKPPWWDAAQGKCTHTKFVHIPVPACVEEGFAEAFASAVSHLLNAPRPSLFFCLQGRNRTGMLAAVIRGIEESKTERALWEYGWCAGKACRERESNFVERFLKDFFG